MMDKFTIRVIELYDNTIRFHRQSQLIALVGFYLNI
jgi:hypothetical protein